MRHLRQNCMYIFFHMGNERSEVEVGLHAAIR